MNDDEKEEGDAVPATETRDTAPIYLRSSGTSVLIGFPAGEAAILHWGADLGEVLPDLAVLGEAVPHSALDVPVIQGLIPQASSGWRGRPGLRGHRAAARAGGGPDGGSGTDSAVPGTGDGAPAGFSSRFRTTAVRRTGHGAEIVQLDPDLQLSVTSRIVLHPGGLLEVAHTLRNDGGTDYALDSLAA
ncbi:MAG TPA: hypothetical protein VIG41_01725, partial [Micrococcaceae bacterium]